MLINKKELKKKDKKEIIIEQLLKEKKLNKEQ